MLMSQLGEILRIYIIRDFFYQNSDHDLRGKVAMVERQVQQTFNRGEVKRRKWKCMMSVCYNQEVVIYFFLKRSTMRL